MSFHTGKNTLTRVLSPGIYLFCRYFQKRVSLFSVENFSINHSPAHTYKSPNSLLFLFAMKINIQNCNGDIFFYPQTMIIVPSQSFSSSTLKASVTCFDHNSSKVFVPKWQQSDFVFGVRTKTCCCIHPSSHKCFFDSNHDGHEAWRRVCKEWKQTQYHFSHFIDASFLCLITAAKRDHLVTYTSSIVTVSDFIIFYLYFQLKWDF